MYFCAYFLWNVSIPSRGLFKALNNMILVRFWKRKRPRLSLSDRFLQWYFKTAQLVSRSAGCHRGLDFPPRLERSSPQQIQSRPSCHPWPGPWECKRSCRRKTVSCWVIPTGGSPLRENRGVSLPASQGVARSRREDGLKRETFKSDMPNKTLLSSFKTRQ